jgi:hypothetical protein
MTGFAVGSNKNGGANRAGLDTGAGCLVEELRQVYLAACCAGRCRLSTRRTVLATCLAHAFVGKEAVFTCWRQAYSSRP